MLAAADPYAVAAIGAVGALLGGLVVTLSQLITTRALRRAQREWIDVEADHTRLQDLREDRRRIYAEFLGLVGHLEVVTEDVVRARRHKMSYDEHRAALMGLRLPVLTSLNSVKLVSSPEVSGRAITVWQGVRANVVRALAWPDAEPPADLSDDIAFLGGATRRDLGIATPSVNDIASARPDSKQGNHP